MREKRLTFFQHLEELRSRIIKSLIFVIVVSCILFNLTDKILLNIVRPVGSLIFIEPAEAFIANIKIAFWGGLFLSSPFILYQIWQFLLSGLNTNERRYVFIFGPLSFIFFMLGAGFGYFIIVPIGIKFLLSFSTDFIAPAISLGRYVSFVGVLTFAFGAIFEIPLVILFLARLGIVTPAFLSTKRRHAVVIIFILAAILTPPDVITQCLMAGPLMILYELSVFFSKLACKRSIATN